jgi:hypothetical protein
MDVAINLRVGARVTDRLLAGFDGGALASRAKGPDEAFQLNYYDLGLMFFPWERGAFLRAAAGRSVLNVDSDGPVIAGRGTYGGWNLVAGGGWAFGLGSTPLHIVVNVDYQAHTFTRSGSIDVASGGGWSAWVALDWN